MCWSPHHSRGCRVLLHCSRVVASSPWPGETDANPVDPSQLYRSFSFSVFIPLLYGNPLLVLYPFIDEISGTPGRSRRHSRSRSVEEAQTPTAFNVFGKGLFELDDFDMCDSSPKCAVTAEEAWQNTNPDIEIRIRAEPDKCVQRWPADRSDTVPLDQSRFKSDCVQCNEKDSKEKKGLTDVELMTERFSKLLLGEDMSGGKKGVSSALALSNAITNLSASIFSELWRLEPLAEERKARWRKEMGWFLSVVDHVVEFVPSYQSSTDGTTVEVMAMKPRSDLQINIPALRKLEAMLFECMDRFTDTEFWYVDKAMAESEKNIYNNDHRQKDKWWLPTPRVPEGGLSCDTRKSLQNQRDSVNQILKAAMAINSQVLSEMEIPDVYWESFPKNGKSILGDIIYRHITSENFCPEILLCSLDISSDHSILDVKNRIEAALVLWRKKIHIKDNKRYSKASWGIVSDEKRELHAERAETLLMLLKLRFPGLPQTVLDMSKIQYNKDVGQSILESYSRVLESLAFNILSRIDDVLHADDIAKRQFKSSAFFSRSTSTDSMRTSFFEDLSTNNSFAPSPMPCIYPTPSSGSPLHVPKHIPAMAERRVEKIPSFNSSPSTKTLSDFIGWQASTPPADDTDQDGCHSFKHKELGLQEQRMKKVPLTNNNYRGRYWSYIESLENMSALHSPLARD
eukprot:Gb_04468 [translate_table: standard]